jgi:hypothetical protein
MRVCITGYDPFLGAATGAVDRGGRGRLHDPFDAVVVTRGKEAIGKVMNDHLNQVLHSQSHRARFFEKPVETLMDDNPLIVDTNEPLTNAYTLALQRDQLHLYHRIIVVHNNELTGIVPAHRLLTKLVELQDAAV